MSIREANVSQDRAPAARVAVGERYRLAERTEWSNGMTTIDRCLDLAPARRTPATRLKDMLSLPPKVLRLFRNRREIATLADFSDEQLADIGLNRRDLRAALSGGVLNDPSDHLTRTARSGRPAFRHRRP